jgi:hypothetical protein
MGYTHYWSNVELNNKIVKDTKAIIKASKTAVAGPQGNGKAIVTSDLISLNGLDSESYETFHIPSGEVGFSYCKTNQLPYDEIVTAILISVGLNSEGEIQSDGRKKEWEAGLALFEKAIRPLTNDEKKTFAFQ